MVPSKTFGIVADLKRGIGDIPQPKKQIRGPVSDEAQKNMIIAQRKRREREAAGIPAKGEKIAALMLRNGIATGHGETVDDLLGELEAWLSRYRIERDDQDRALADAIRETARCADELAFWRYQAICGNRISM